MYARVPTIDFGCESKAACCISVVKRQHATQDAIAVRTRARTDRRLPHLRVAKVADLEPRRLATVQQRVLELEIAVTHALQAQLI